MGIISQPSSQIKLTNVSLVRMKKGKKRFEIACYQNKVQDYRTGVEKDLDEVLQIPQVFVNVSKGLIAPQDDLQKSFGHTDQDKIIQEILKKGEIQLNERERNAKQEQDVNEILQIISSKCVNPKNKKRYTTTMIAKALAELKFNLNGNKPTKIRALEAIKLLTQKQIIPLARAKMKLRITLPSKDAKGELGQTLRKLIDTVIDEFQDSEWECVCLIEPESYREIGEHLNGKNKKPVGNVEVLDMAVIDEDGDQNI
ncbi:unnamed protein product [Kuraishia capsulata CBS 1993]|uniref:Ribosome maturation protein SDO1 n=1 Tax=Kuraishia capsulata CBS 1993 TaxID=1382522 RepID=W6MXJ9_9ASCO|nr:uncharacterized protein KUCA_T00005006001 [Kuraishia capsulata CBS 1993]CDK29020.1 unnamed protein product [Kuraishia capsulata CBS 1993]